MNVYLAGIIVSILVIVAVIYKIKKNDEAPAILPGVDTPTIPPHVHPVIPTAHPAFAWHRGSQPPISPGYYKELNQKKYLRGALTLDERKLLCEQHPDCVGFDNYGGYYNNLTHGWSGDWKGYMGKNWNPTAPRYTYTVNRAKK